MSYRRRRYYRPPAPVKQEPDGCLIGIIGVLITWGLGILAVGIAIAMGFTWGLCFLAVGFCLLLVAMVIEFHR